MVDLVPRGQSEEDERVQVWDRFTRSINVKGREI